MKALLQAQIFSGFPAWKAISYQGELTPKSSFLSMDGDLDCHDFRSFKSKKIMTPKILKFEVTVEEEDPRPLYLASIISREEKVAWQSFQDVLDHTALFTQNAGLRGFFGLEVLSVDLHSGLRDFNPNNLSKLIVNHSKTLGPDQRALIRYGQFFALLHYRAPADWGKMEVRTHVDFFSQKPASAGVSEESVREALFRKRAGKKKAEDQLDLFLKRLLNEGGRDPCAVYLVHDLSLQPVWDPAHETQQQRVRVWLKKEREARNGILPEIYLYHSSRKICISLLN